jgi:hypothetical protein
MNLAPNFTMFCACKVHFRDKAIPIQSWTDPEGSRGLRPPEFLDNRHMTFASLPALCNGRLYPPTGIPSANLCYGLSRAQVHSAELIIIIIIIIIITINCNWVFTRWQWLIYMYTMYNIATKFTSRGLLEKHVVSTWNFGNHLSICF